MTARDDRTMLFTQLAEPTAIDRFFDRVSDDVRWTVEGISPISGHCTSKQAFLQATFGRLAPLLRDGVHLEFQNLIMDGRTSVVELQARSTTLDGAPYNYRLCWLCTFDSADIGAQIVSVRAYVDTVTVTWTILRNESDLVDGRRRGLAPPQ